MQVVIKMIKIINEDILIPTRFKTKDGIEIGLRARFLEPQLIEAIKSQKDGD